MSDSDNILSVSHDSQYMCSSPASYPPPPQYPPPPPPSSLCTGMSVKLPFEMESPVSKEECKERSIPRDELLFMRPSKREGDGRLIKVSNVRSMIVR